MILVGERRAEQRHDAVAHHLVDGALVAVDRLHHALEHRVEERARLLGVAVGEQLHRALEVGEQHRDLLALAFERALGGEDLARRGASGCRPGARAGAPARGRRRCRRSRRIACPAQLAATLAQVGDQAAAAFLAEPQPSRFSAWHRGHFTSALLGVGAVQLDSPTRVALPSEQGGSRTPPGEGGSAPPQTGLSGPPPRSGGSAGPRPGRRGPGRRPARSAPRAAPRPSAAPSRASRRPDGPSGTSRRPR